VTQEQVDTFFSVWNQSTFIDQLDFKKKSQKKPMLFEETRDPPQEEFYDNIEQSIKKLKKGFTAYKFNYTNNHVKKVKLSLSKDQTRLIFSEIPMTAEEAEGGDADASGQNRCCGALSCFFKNNSECRFDQISGVLLGAQSITFLKHR